MHTISNIGIIVGNSKRVNLNMEVTRKQSTPSFPKNEHFILLDTHTYVFSRTYHTFSQEKLLFYNSPESFSGFLVSIAVVIIICFAKKETIHISAISKTLLSSIAVADFNKVTHYRSFDIPKKYFLYQLYSQPQVSLYVLYLVLSLIKYCNLLFLLCDGVLFLHLCTVLYL